MLAAEFDKGFLWRFRARPDRVIDGDTFTVVADCGFGSAALPRIRVRGLNAPERFTPEGPAATGRLVAALNPTVLTEHNQRWPLRIVSLQRESVVEETRSFERYIADVYIVKADGSLIDLKELMA
jgi:endonuclease YncB( thermonuclease family)